MLKIKNIISKVFGIPSSKEKPQNTMWYLEQESNEDQPQMLIDTVDTKVFEEILKTNQPVINKTKENGTLLHYTMLHDKIEAVKIFPNNNANINMRNGHVETSLDIATRLKKTCMEEFLRNQQPCPEFVTQIEKSGIEHKINTEKQVVGEVDQKDINIRQQSFSNNGWQIAQQNKNSNVTALVEGENPSALDIKKEDTHRKKIDFFNNFSNQQKEPSYPPKLSLPRLKSNTFGAADSFTNADQKPPSNNNDAFKAKIKFFNDLSVRRKESLHSPKLKFNRSTLSADFNVSTKLNETNLTSISRTQSHI